MATLDLSGVPATVTIENIGTKAKELNVYRNFTKTTLEAGDSIVLYVDNSSELLFWSEQAVANEITVTIEAVA